MDANIFVAAQWNPRSASARLLRMCQEGGLRLCYSRPIREEIYLTLRNTRAPDRFLETVDSLFASGRCVRRTRRIRAIEDDPEDEKYLEWRQQRGPASSPTTGTC